MLSEEDHIAEWRIDRFTEMGFNMWETGALLAWQADVHETHDLLWRDGVRTACTHEQALRILRPLEVIAEVEELFSVRV